MKDLVSGNYDKIKHLVEIDQDILTVFIISSNQINELYIAKNSSVDKPYIESIFKILYSDKDEKILLENETTRSKDIQNLGHLKWVVLEYDKLRVLKIYEPKKIIIVLMNSNSHIERTLGNILGYYYDLDEMPKSLF